LNERKDMDSNFRFPDADVSHLQNLQSIARGGTEAKGIFCDKNGTPFTITMKNERCKLFFHKTKVTISPLKDRSTAPSTKLIFDRGKIDIGKISSAMDGLSKKVENKTPPRDRSDKYQTIKQKPANERSSHFQEMAKSYLEGGQSELAASSLKLAHQQWHTPDGLKAWQEIGPGGRAGYFQTMADSYIKVETPESKAAAAEMLRQAGEQWNSKEGQQAWLATPSGLKADWHSEQAKLYEKLGDQGVAKRHKQQASFEGLPANERSAHFQKLAEDFLRGKQPELAAANLKLASQQWQDPDGQLAWDVLEPAKRFEWLQTQANVCNGLGNRQMGDWYAQQANWYAQQANSTPLDPAAQAERLAKANALKASEAEIAEAMEIMGFPKSTSLDTITPSELKIAYRRKSQQIHPDKNNEDHKATEKFQELHAAYELLKHRLTQFSTDEMESFAKGIPCKPKALL
jgi:hypothetical protein